MEMMLMVKVILTVIHVFWHTITKLDFFGALIQTTAHNAHMLGQWMANIKVFCASSKSFDYMSIYTAKAIRLNAFSTSGQAQNVFLRPHLNLFLDSHRNRSPAKTTRTRQAFCTDPMPSFNSTTKCWRDVFLIVKHKELEEIYWKICFVMDHGIKPHYKENWSSTESGFSQGFFSIFPCSCRFGLLTWGQLIFSKIIDLIAQRLWMRSELKMTTSLSTNL